MNQVPVKVIQIGKKVGEDFYVHVDYLGLLGSEEARSIVQVASSLLQADDLKLCNVAKINIARQRLSFLQYLDFDTDPYPTLNGAWVTDINKQSVSFRNYSNSLNPPILHRKELLVGPDHPNKSDWIQTTKFAEDLGLFDDTRTIGFRENWLRLIHSKGFRLQNAELVPLGNQLDADTAQASWSEQSSVRRHLTALSRTTLSAPMQLLIGHGLINTDVSLFDYGCGRGDDLKGLMSIGVQCRGWDPHYAQDNEIVQADIVNLGFVVNVIEDPAERVEALQKAFALATTAMVVSVMLYSTDRPGKPYLDGYLTGRNTFQKYFSQDEFKDYLEHVLLQDPVMIGPGIALVFKDKDAEQRFLINRYRSSNMAKRLLSARLNPQLPRQSRPERLRALKVTKAEREFLEFKPQLDHLWALTLELGRFPESFEIPNLLEIQQTISITRASRLIRTHYDLTLLDQAVATRSDEIKLYLASLQFGKKAPYKNIEPRLRLDVRHFFGDYKAANTAALQLLLASGNGEVVHQACIEAAANGLGWLDEDRSLQLHISLIERLPAVLRAYISCGLLLWDNISAVQLVKIHIGSGKLTLLEYDDFEGQAIPLLVKRVKVNIRKLDYDVFDYEAPQYPPTPLLFKSRYMHEDMPNYAEQFLFDEQLEALDLINQFDAHPSRIEIDQALESRRLEIKGVELTRSSRIPPLDQTCGQNMTYRHLVECGETQARLGVQNLPMRSESYNALYDLCIQVIDPVIDYFGAIRLTFGFCSQSLAAKIEGRIAPKLDQHACHELNKLGKPICTRLGAAVDFIVDDEDMLEVAQWIVENTNFDRLYFYGSNRPIHVSYSETPAGQVTVMNKRKTGQVVPKNVSAETFKTKQC